MRDRMACCGRSVIGKIKNIAKGYANLAIDKKCEDTDARIAICMDCDEKLELGKRKRLFCGICLCYIPAKARVEDEKCQLGKWQFEGHLHNL